MYAIKFAKSYKKSLKRILKSGNKSDIEKIEEVIDVLASGRDLLPKYNNHYLTGDLSEFQECHVKSDLLLVYCKYQKELILVLVDVGSHSELFR